MIYKRFKIFFLCIGVLFAFLFNCSCTDKELVKQGDYHPKLEGGLSVCYLAVGQGDCSLIKLPNGKIMLVDCGDRDSLIKANIENVLNCNGINKIDYLVLTHTDIDHIGNAYDIISDYEIDTCFVPYVINQDLFPTFRDCYNLLKTKANKIIYSERGRVIKGESFNVSFLMPSPIDQMGEYDDLNYGEATSEQINAVSAVIYIEYKGVKFLFCADATYAVEGKMVEYSKAGLYRQYSADLNNVDFLKVSHHGGSEEIHQKFYELVCPKNAIFSVGGINNYNHPSEYTLLALKGVREDVNFLRTDTHGTIYVNVSDCGVKIETAKSVNEK